MMSVVLLVGLGALLISQLSCGMATALIVQFAQRR